MFFEETCFCSIFTVHARMTYTPFKYHDQLNAVQSHSTHDIRQTSLHPPAFQLQHLDALEEK